MTKRDFEKIFKKGFNKRRIYYEDAQNKNSEIRCFKCGAQAGLRTSGGWWRRRTKVRCVRGHSYNLIKYAQLYADMVYDTLQCQNEKACIVQGDI